METTSLLFDLTQLNQHIDKLRAEDNYDSLDASERGIEVDSIDKSNFDFDTFDYDSLAFDGIYFRGKCVLCKKK